MKRIRNTMCSAHTPFTRSTGSYLTFPETVYTENRVAMNSEQSASQGNEATPRGRPADRSETCDCTGQRGRIVRDWANERATYWEFIGGG